ncbi:MAG TPA: hypothetical protein VF669_12770 [Tepidisphaeraceae bacterium]|jgi:hypothetical protein
MGRLSVFDRAIATVAIGPRSSGTPGAIDLASHLVSSLLGELEYLWTLYFSVDPEADPAAEVELREMFERWADAGDEALDRLARLQREESIAVPSYVELMHGHGRVRAMLSVSLEDLAEVRAQIRRGEVIPLEEVKRELRLRRKPQSSDGAGNA